MTLDELNARDRRGLVVALGSVFENSPWVAEAAVARHPFPSLDALYRAMLDAVRGASEEAQLGLIRAHPDLAGKAAVQGEIGPDSQSEQAGAGLTSCSPEELLRLQALNRAYRRKFGFPFVIAVKGLDRRAIIARFAERLERDRATEFEEALQQIARIAWLRLEALIEE